MDFVSDHLNSATSQTLSNVNSRARKRKNQQDQVDENDKRTRLHAVDLGQSLQASSGLLQSQSQTIDYGHSAKIVSNPFGGDFSATLAHSQQPLPIGFRPELLTSATNLTSTDATDRPHESSTAAGDATGSNASLYEGDAWARLWFQRVMVLSLIRLLVFIRKVYEDFDATKKYSISSHSGHFIISAATLFLPTIVFTIYRVARYLQTALPETRVNETSTKAATSKVRVEADGDIGDKESRRALMGRNSSLSNNQPVSINAHDDDGLVTATGTPTNLEEQFHDSRSQQDQVLASNQSVSPAPSTAIVKDSPEERRLNSGTEPTSIQVDRVRVANQFADKKGARVVIGASEQLLHGVLFIFWQLKRQVDVLGYLVERSCLWRKPRTQEQVELERLRTGSDGLEWFQDFYAAFLAILAQIYTLGLHWNTDGKTKSIQSSQGASAILASSPTAAEISGAARGLANTVGQQVALNLQGSDLLIMSQIVVSSAVVFSLLIAVRRRDDGPMTLGLSMLGWGAIFAARIIIIALAFVHIGWHIMLSLVVCHILGITAWIYKIALDSHNGKSAETEEYKWDPEAVESTEDKTDEGHDNVVNRSIELGAVRPEVNTDQSTETNLVTKQWSIMEHVVLLSQIITLFAIPSLFYWPIMFNLKLHCRPFKYLLIILVQNFILIPAIWWTIPAQGSMGQWYLLGAVGGFSIIGFLFLFLYVSCKPSLTEYFARADEILNEAERSGIYFEFCSRVFKMPDLSKHAFRRLMNQTEQLEEVAN